MSMKKALLFVTKAYKNNTAIMHPIAVALAAGEWGLPREIQQVALLHDILKDTSVTKQELVDNFDEYIADVVVQLTGTEREHLKGISQYAQIVKMLEIMDNLQNINDPAPEYIDEIKELFKILERAHWRIAKELMLEIIKVEQKCMIA